MSLSRNRGAALRGLLIGTCVAAATTAALITGPASASGSAAIPAAAVPGSAAVPVKAAGTTGGAVDTTPPSEPGILGTRNVYLNTALGLVWTPSTDDTGVTGYEVYTWTHTSPESATFTSSPLVIVSSTSEQIFGYTYNLIPDRAYAVYLVAVDAAGNRSVPSLLTTGTAMQEPPIPLPTPTPVPPRPSAQDLQAATGPAPGQVSLTWSGYTDPTADFVWHVFRRSATEWSHAGHSSLPQATAQIGDEPSYTFQVVARLADSHYLGRPSNAAAYSSPSPSPSPASPACAVTYRATTWGGGFTAGVTIKNTGTTTINGWRLRFSFPAAGQRVVRGWSAGWTQSGTAVTARSTTWNKVIKPGKSQIIGFTGKHTGTNSTPTAFTVNGKPCSTG